MDTHWYKLAPNSYIVFSKMNRDGSWECDIKFREQTIGHKNHGVLGINFLENYVQLYEVEQNTMCFKPIPEDSSLLDAQNVPIIGFGEVKRVENNAYVDNVVSGVALGLTFLAYALRMVLTVRMDRTEILSKTKV